MEQDLKQLQKQEAMHRLKLLKKCYNMHPNVLNEFKADGTIYYSERINAVYAGILYWVSNKQEYIDAIKEVEEEYNIYVYHCILVHTEFGDWLSMLFVSENMDNWIEEQSDLMTGILRAYTYDFSDLGFEFGDIQIAGANGGLTRIN